jgi:adenosylhomocysteine nucleosidase
MTIAIMSAMAEENAALVSQMTGVFTTKVGGRTYHQGELWGHSVVMVFSHWGKVAAASTTTYLIAGLGVKEVIFTGVAGGIHPDLNVGDIVIAKQLYQHDMDASPIIPRHEIPLLGRAGIDSYPERRAQLQRAAENFVSEDLSRTISSALREEFALTGPKVRVGDIASGDQFISSDAEVEDLRERLPNVICVEMEGAAVAQVCDAFHVPLSVIRTISDSADDEAAINFPRFISEVAKLYSLGILRCLLDKDSASTMSTNKNG